MVINLLYLSFRYSQTPLRMMFYITLLFPWVWLVFQNAFSVLGFWVNLLYAAALWHGVRERHPVLSESDPGRESLLPPHKRVGYSRS